MRAKLAEWWPELIAAGLFGTYMVAMRAWGGTALVVVFAVIFWAMGRRHRALPRDKRVDKMTDAAERMTESVGELVEEIRDEREPEPCEQGPRLRLVPERSDSA